jgi:hypothetical protein
MPSAYDDVIEPPYRIQKRLVLNQCFKAILGDLATQPSVFTYVTFGGKQLYDLLDLVGVFDIQKSKIHVKSYEELPDVAKAATTCPVSKTLGKMATISIDIVPNALHETTLTPLVKGSVNRPFLYFLDYLNPYGLSHQATLLALIRARCLRAGDYLMITSNLTPRVMNNSRRPFMENQLSAFRTYFGLAGAPVPPKFRERNHVDLLVGQACSIIAGESTPGPYIDSRLLGKYRYRDTTPMGVWIYKIEKALRVATRLKDVQFRDYPWPISLTEKAELLPAEPQLFFDLPE